MRYLFYSAGPEDRVPAPAPLPAGYTAEFWRPSWSHIIPRRAGIYPYAAFWSMDRLRLFANRDYAAFLIFFGNQLVHRAAVTPADFRFPFMAAADLQIGNVFTHEQHRARGLAVFSIRSIVDAMKAERRKFWYVTPESNLASRYAAEKAGLHAVGIGARRGIGLPFLVRYRLEEPWHVVEQTKVMKQQCCVSKMPDGDSSL
jgi:GNAT superfamily N-acetyltransferase